MTSDEAFKTWLAAYAKNYGDLGTVGEHLARQAWLACGNYHEQKSKHNLEDVTSGAAEEAAFYARNHGGVDKAFSDLSKVNDLVLNISGTVKVGDTSDTTTANEALSVAFGERTFRRAEYRDMDEERYNFFVGRTITHATMDYDGEDPMVCLHFNETFQGHDFVMLYANEEITTDA